MIYPILSLSFLALAFGVLAVSLIAARRARSIVRRWVMPAVVSFAMLAVLTAVFDNLMIAGGFMSYRADRISGLHVGLVPLEDFAYPLAALVLLPALWFLTGSRSRADRAAR